MNKQQKHDNHLTNCQMLTHSLAQFVLKYTIIGCLISTAAIVGLS